MIRCMTNVRYVPSIIGPVGAGVLCTQGGTSVSGGGDDCFACPAQACGLVRAAVQSLCRCELVFVALGYA